MMKTLFIFVFAVMLVGCASSNNSTLYQQINGEQGVEKLVDSFINQIGRDEQILAYFKQTNVARFRQGFITHLYIKIQFFKMMSTIDRSKERCFIKHLSLF